MLYLRVQVSSADKKKPLGEAFLIDTENLHKKLFNKYRKVKL